MIVRFLSQAFRVQLVGFEQSGSVYRPAAETMSVEDELRFHAKTLPGWWFESRKLAKSIRGEAIVCVKPALGSYGTGVILGRRLKRPVIVDIDDWEIGFLTGSPYWEFRAWGLRWFTSSDSPLYTRFLDGCLGLATDRTVTNSFLQALYGGHWLPHTRDECSSMPIVPTPAGAHKTVLFGGSPRGHKGLAPLLRVWRRLGRTDATLRLAVPDPHDKFLAALKPLEVPGVVVTGPHPFAEMLRIVSDATLIAIPQDNAPGSVGQLPMKMLEAMAAGKPIVATDVADTAKWLGGGAGIVVAAGSDDALAEGLAYALDHPEVWGPMGAKARTRYLALASEAVLGPRMCAVASAAIQRVPLDPRAAFDPALLRREATTRIV